VGSRGPTRKSPWLPDRSKSGVDDPMGLVEVRKGLSVGENRGGERHPLDEPAANAATEAR